MRLKPSFDITHRHTRTCKINILFRNNRKLKHSDEIDREKRLHAARVVGGSEEWRRDNANRMNGIDGEKEGRAR